jgi:hypothetical protein
MVKLSMQAKLTISARSIVKRNSRKTLKNNVSKKLEKHEHNN